MLVIALLFSSLFYFAFFASNTGGSAGACRPRRVWAGAGRMWVSDGDPVLMFPVARTENGASEQLAGNVGLGAVEITDEQRKALGRMIHQHRILRLMRQAGRGQDRELQLNENLSTRCPADDEDFEVEHYGPRPTVVADRGIFFSSDGRRRKEELLNVAHKKRRLEPEELNDSLGHWIPVGEDGFAPGELPDPAPDVNETDAATVLGKRKEYASTHDPMSLWRPLKGFFLDEILRHEGLGDELQDPRCAHCLKELDAEDPSSLRFFKCGDCGEFLQCEMCCLAHHKRTPLHVVLEWNGFFWAKCTLADLGLVYQLGHGGFPCGFPDDTVYKMTVIEAPVIHQVKIRYCKCSKSDDADNLDQLMRNSWYPATVSDPATCATFKSLEAYRLYNVVGNMNVRDFITALERMTDTTALTGMSWLPDRYKQFQRMARQWAFLKRLEHAGRGHDPSGVEKTALGECAVRCWACPHDGRNLPKNWRDTDPKFQFLYMLLLAVDANFRLKNRMRPNEIDDPSLGPGWGFWVEPVKYRRHIRKYVNEKDISTCIAFAALLQKDTRITTGLRVSGVGGCVCARHECMRPNGLGDLQKGERYANMDFIVMAALAGFALIMLTISYDISCQWKVNLATRMQRLPKKMRLPLDKIKVEYALPVWHAASHNEECQRENSLSVKPGVGKTDGEGVERTWSVLNPAAFSTKDAGRGQRADVLDSKIDNHNHTKNLGEGVALQRKLVLAIAERDRQISIFDEVSASIEEEVQSEWRKMIADWEDDHSKPNPYILSRKVDAEGAFPVTDCPTETEVRLQVRRDEEALSAGGNAPLHGRSATAFLVAGIQIEDAQARIVAELRGTALVAADRENRIQEWRHALLVKISKFRTLQKIYTPGAVATMEKEELERDQDCAPPKAENVKLYMPSEMSAEDDNDTLRGSVSGLLGMEEKLRVAQCDNSLVSLRARLHAKGHLIGFRNSNVTGQVAATKARTLIEEVGERVESYAKRYRRGRAALQALGKEAEYPHFKELLAAHVQLDGDAGESDAASIKRLGLLASGLRREARHAPGTTRRVLSWIWTAPGALEDKTERVHESVRVEWTRALARKERWREEVLLLREEMRRVLRYLGWQADWWRERVGPRPEDADDALAAGLRAYALKQAAWHDRLRGFWRIKWEINARTAAEGFVAVERAGRDLERLFADERAEVVSEAVLGVAGGDLPGTPVTESGSTRT
ncbi:hypothetical protein C8R43DRAFT_1127191 [Mycena crocata]|nr:hypothetical protein C8R43DRAFT_1127191 [Mycena crocata]